MLSQRHSSEQNHCLSRWHSTGKIQKGNLHIPLGKVQTALKGRPETGNKLLHGAIAPLLDLVAILLYSNTGITQITTGNLYVITNVFRRPAPRLIQFFPVSHPSVALHLVLIPCNNPLNQTPPCTQQDTW